ncbi:MAG: hypothetical protein ACRD24_06510 [Terriglobales bacterium]
MTSANTRPPEAQPGYKIAKVTVASAAGLSVNQPPNRRSGP